MGIFDPKGVPEENVGSWRSIEFECIFNSAADLTEFLKFAQDKTNGYEKFITVKNDGSINPKHYSNVSKEIIVSFCSGQAKIVWDVCKFLKDHAYVNESCGTHVHFDVRQLSKAAVQRIGARLACAVPALKLIVPKSRRNHAKCHDVINSIDGNGKDTYAFGYLDDRYTFINLQSYKKYKTIEVRGHSGTLSARKILNWIKICETIMEHKKPEHGKLISTPDDLIQFYGFEENLAEFIRARYVEVNPPKKEKPKPEPKPMKPNVNWDGHLDEYYADPY